MANDFMSAFGGLMGGMSKFMPQDDPAVQLMNSQNELNELMAKEEALFAQIGRQAQAANPAAYAESQQIQLVQTSIAEAEAKLAQAQQAKAAAEAQAQEAQARNTCRNCGEVNPDGTKFCQGCGQQLGGGSTCPQCGQAFAPGTRFCGGCGAQVG